MECCTERVRDGGAQVTMQSCVANAGACAGGTVQQCVTEANCTGGSLCCRTGGGGGGGGAAASTTCSAACANGSTPICASNSGCPANMVCNVGNGQATGTCRAAPGIPDAGGPG
jgi:hypothetical protein